MAIMQDSSVEGDPGFGKCLWCGRHYDVIVVEMNFKRKLSNVSEGRCPGCQPPRRVYSAAMLQRIEAARNGYAVDPSLDKQEF